jgi:predicted  nucleic acid-binding Zn-ribbon protein
MLEVVEHLLALQDRDQRLRNVRLELQAVPAEIAARQKLVTDANARLEASKARAKAIEVEKKTLTGDADAKRAQIDRYKNQQLQTRKNEEYSALAHEIAAAQKQITTIEDKELVLMEEAESLAPAISEAEKTFTAEKTRLEGQIATIKEKEANLTARLADLEQERAAATAGIDEELLERYERLFETKNARAVVTVEHDVCSGCHMKVTAQTSLALRSDKALVSCPQCGRILHLPL